jgi:uncharacterized protein (TIGR00369 family)
MPVDPKHVRLVTEILMGSALAQRLGIGLDTLEPDRVVLRMPFRPDNVTLGSVVHGGAIATLVDVAGAAASASGAAPEVGGGATSSLALSYLAPADGVDLAAEARVIQRGRSQTVSDVEVRDPSGRLVAKGLVTSRLF